MEKVYTKLLDLPGEAMMQVLTAQMNGRFNELFA